MKDHKLKKTIFSPFEMSTESPATAKLFRDDRARYNRKKEIGQTADLNRRAIILIQRRRRRGGAGAAA
jgi:hypothetical protein